jgi:molybdopterin molybdotransferase
MLKSVDPRPGEAAVPELFNVCSPDDARALLCGRIETLVRRERCTIDDALDRVTAAELRSPVDLPAFPRSTMDGYALRAVDSYGASESMPAYLKLTGEVPMGKPAGLQVGTGALAKVHTGGMIPDGANAVVMIENTQLVDERTVEVVRPVAVGENVIPVAEDIHAGALVLPRGHRLRPQDLGALAGVGITEIEAVARPLAGILATGDEVVAASAQVEPGQVRDVNTSTVSALIRRAGGIPRSCGIIPDNFEALAAAAREALDACDLLIISAGSSVSTRDMTAAVIEQLGPPGVLVHGVSMHPGKPTILALAGGKPVFGLPGNPVSTMIAFQLFVAPAMAKLLGSERVERRLVPARLAHNVASIPGREDYVQTRLEQRNGELWAEPVFGKSNLIYTMVRSDGLIHVPLDRAGLYAGDVVEVELF